MTVAVHMAKRIAPIDWKGVPSQFVGKCSAVCRTAAECDELEAWFGDPNFCPFLPVMVMVPGTPAPTLIQGMGYATAAELRDCAVVTWHSQVERMAKQGALVDFDVAREKRGLMRREDVDAAVRDAMLRRVEQHKANPVTDPFRQPVRQNPTGRTVFKGAS